MTKIPTSENPPDSTAAGENAQQVQTDSPESKSPEPASVPPAGESATEQPQTEVEAVSDSPSESAPGNPQTAEILPPSEQTTERIEEEEEEEEEDKGAEGDAGNRMSFLDHLMELRKRLMGGVISVILTTILSFVFYSHIFAFLRVPIDNINQRYRDDPDLTARATAIGLDPEKGVIVPISTEPLGLIIILLKVAVLAGLVLSSPIVVYQFWSFVAPGLKQGERRAIQPLLLGGLLFFIAGASFCYYLVFPLTLNFLVWLDVSMGFAPQYTPNHYIGLLVTFMLIFGLVFELPLVASILALLRILSPEFLTRFWRYVILICFLMGSILSPGGDPMSMLMMSGCLVVLYVVSIFLVKMLYPKEAE